MARRLHARVSGRSEVVVDGEVVLRRRSGRRGSTPTRCGPGPPSRPPRLFQATVTEPSSGPAVALYLQDAHPIREAMELRPATPRRRDSTRCGRPTAGWCASAACRWPPSPPSRSASGSARAWSTAGARNPARLAATFSTLDDLAPGRVILGIGAWWDPLAAKVGIDRARPADGHARGRHRGAGACWPTRPSPSTASSSTSTASSSTTCTRSAGRRTCPSTSAPPACR